MLQEASYFMMKLVIFILQITLLISVAIFSAHGQQYKLVCYFSNWSQYRLHPFRYFPSDIDPNLCTHLNYAFARLSGNRILPYEWNDESTPWSVGHYQQVMNLKDLNPNLKILLALGGWNHGSGPFSRMVATDANIAEFAQNAIAFLRYRNFDGIDIDWEYPGVRDGSNPATDKERYSALLVETRRAFEEESRQTGKEQLLLTAALPAGKGNIDIGYDLPLVGQYLDFVNIMSYDYHGQWDDYTGVNAPLYGRQDDTGDRIYLNQNWTVNYYIDNGIPREKLIMGLATFGRSFTLQNSLNNQIGDVAIRGGTRGTYTRETGYLAYYEICTSLRADSANRWTKQWDDQQFSPFAYWRDQWVGYDDRESVDIKTRYIVANDFGGAMVWELASDDYRGVCQEGTYPLIRTVKSVFDEFQSFTPQTSTTQQTTTTATTTTTASTITTTTTPRTTTTTPRTTTTTPRTTTTTPRTTTIRITTKPTPTTTTTPKTTTTTTPRPTTTLTTTTKSTGKPITSTIQTTQRPPVTTTTCRPSVFFGCNPITTTTGKTPTTPHTLPPTTTRRPLSNAKRRMNSTEQNFGELCTEAGMLLPYNPDCSRYVQCVHILSPTPSWYIMSCQPGLYFRPDKSYCDFPGNVPDCPQPEIPTTPIIAIDPGRPANSDPVAPQGSAPLDPAGSDPSIDISTSPEPTVTSPPYERNKPRAGFDGSTTAVYEICEPGKILEYNADCSSYVACVFWKLHYIMPCPQGLYYNKAGICDWPRNVPECNY